LVVKTRARHRATRSRAPSCRAILRRTSALASVVCVARPAHSSPMCPGCEGIERRFSGCTKAPSRCTELPSDAPTMVWTAPSSRREATRMLWESETYRRCSEMQRRCWATHR
jgi:hypothetical protein